MRNAFNVITFHVSITAGKKCLLFLLNAVKSGTTLVWPPLLILFNGRSFGVFVNRQYAAMILEN